jgi:flagellum-specific ATP synthase
VSVLGASIETLRRIESREVVGAVASVRGLSLLVEDLPLPVGALVRIEGRPGAVLERDQPMRGEVIGFDAGRAVVMLFDANDGIAPGMRVVGEQSAQTVPVGRSLLGRVIDGLGRPIDGGPRLTETVPRPLVAPPTSPLERKRIGEPLPTGIRVVDGMVTIGKGQRVGVFSGPGIGKSTLLATIARNTEADVNVIALVGERGREVRDFIDVALGPAGLERSVLVTATSDESPLLRVRAAAVASSMAEYFRDLGHDVLLIMDSVTRFAQAQRQIGLTVGEQPATKGYPPSVFALMPTLLERAGAMRSGGSITGLYAVLVEGDDLSEPISDAARGILDGHLALSRRLASRGHYPAVDLLESISRVADDVCDPHHVAARRTLIRLIAAYAEAEELINIGAYARGSNPDCDVAIEMREDIETFLRQSSGEPAAYPETCKRLLELAVEAEQRATARAAAVAPGGAAAPVPRPDR